MFKKTAKCFTTCLASSVLLWTGISSAEVQQEELLTPTISVSSEQIPPSNVESPITISGGAWVSSGTAPTIRNSGLLYTLNLPVVGSVPFGSKINVVNYSWSFSKVPPGMIVYLCWNSTSACVDVTSNKSGRLTNFAGLDANKKFIFAYGVRGNGSAISPPAYGQRSQVIVNYD